MTSNQEFDPKIIDEFKITLMQLNGVQAVGESIADGKPCLKAYFLDEAKMKATIIPDTVLIPVFKVISGSIHSQ
ncbi:MAG: hypothetical protein ACI87E_003792 [Mariniblastus sp.]|jgi:hypothetical protein